VASSLCVICSAEKEPERPFCPACDTAENRAALRKVMSGPSALLMAGAVITVTLVGAPIGVTLIVVGLRQRKQRLLAFKESRSA
jgi:hypothetical protein